MNNEPAPNTKSTPRTESQIEVNSRAQYDIEGLLTMNSIIAVLDANVPAPGTSGRYFFLKKEITLIILVYGPKSQTSGIKAAINPIKTLHIRPVTKVGMIRMVVCMGV